MSKDALLEIFFSFRFGIFFPICFADVTHYVSVSSLHLFVDFYSHYTSGSFCPVVRFFFFPLSFGFICCRFFHSYSFGVFQQVCLRAGSRPMLAQSRWCCYRNGAHPRCPQHSPTKRRPTRGRPNILILLIRFLRVCRNEDTCTNLSTVCCTFREDQRLLYTNMFIPYSYSSQ